MSELGVRLTRLIRKSWQSDAWHVLRRRPVFWISMTGLGVALIMAALPGLFTSLAPNEACAIRKSKEPPVSGAIFGYDLQGCDYWSQVVHAVRPSIIIGLGVTIFCLAIAIVLGMLAGFYGGVLDSIISRVTDIVFGIPFVLGAAVMLVAFPHSTIWTMTFIIVVLNWTSMTRIMRGQVIAVRGMDYVRAAEGLGAGRLRIMFRHILPNAFSPVFVYAMLNVGNVISIQATLDYLGVGLQYPQTSWGSQLSVAKSFFGQHPHLLIFPAIFISVTVLSFLLLGDAVRDALDPKLR